MNKELKELLETNNIEVVNDDGKQATFNCKVNKKDMDPDFIELTEEITLDGLIDKYSEEQVIKAIVDAKLTKKINYHRANVMVSPEEQEELKKKELEQLKTRKAKLEQLGLSDEEISKVLFK